ncbi:MAG TPA: polysaccharide export protein [Bacteroidaceae bacterium]|nr:polysaccharide export protein [Bacteroidaceae bacterium]
MHHITAKLSGLTQKVNKMKILRNTLITLSIATIVFSSCTSQKELTYLSNLDTTSVQQFFPMERPDYRIQYQDILYVDIFTMNQEMNELLNSRVSTSSSYMYRDPSGIYIYGYTVSDSGYISIPMLGDVYVYGHTLGEIKQIVRKRADEYLKNPTINVKLLTFKFTVIGEVNHPGTYTNFNNQLTVLEAIGMGGDITDYGNRKKVLVLRPTREGTHTYRINLQDKNLLQSQGYFLLPNDVVIVEPIKSKPFNLNLPTYAFIISSLFSAISTTLVLIAFLNSPR